jgi:hypothetical protein
MEDESGNLVGFDFGEEQGVTTLDSCLRECLRYRTHFRFDSNHPAAAALLLL